MEGIKAMNGRNLKEGQWGDREQWSLGVGQRRKTFQNRRWWWWKIPRHHLGSKQRPSDYKKKILQLQVPSDSIMDINIKLLHCHDSSLLGLHISLLQKISKHKQQESAGGTNHQKKIRANKHQCTPRDSNIPYNPCVWARRSPSRWAITLMLKTFHGHFSVESVWSFDNGNRCIY
jgi:hypothetical protein